MRILNLSWWERKISENYRGILTHNWSKVEIISSEINGVSKKHFYWSFLRRKSLKIKNNLKNSDTTPQPTRRQQRQYVEEIGHNFEDLQAENHSKVRNMFRFASKILRRKYSQWKWVCVFSIWIGHLSGHKQLSSGQHKHKEPGDILKAGKVFKFTLGFWAFLYGFFSFWPAFFNNLT